jgi:hypothetical protein
MSNMTWTLTHDNETIGEWADDLVDRIATKLKNFKSCGMLENEVASTVAEFLPEPIGDAILHK